MAGHARIVLCKDEVKITYSPVLYISGLFCFANHIYPGGCKDEVKTVCETVGLFSTPQGATSVLTIAMYLYCPKTHRGVGKSGHLPSCGVERLSVVLLNDPGWRL